MEIKINKLEKRFHISELPNKIHPDKVYKRISGDNDTRYYFIADENCGIMELIHINDSIEKYSAIALRSYDYFKEGFSSGSFVEEVNCKIEIIITEL